jgi:hypothetical protein
MDPWVLHYPVSQAPRGTHVETISQHGVQIYPSLYRQLLETRHQSAHSVLYLAAMSKGSKRSRRSRGPIDRSATTDIVTQLEIASRNPHAAAIGAVIGGLVPWFGRTLAHGEIQGTWSSNRPLAIAMVAVVLGCGVFSGLSVYKFGRAAFGDPRKALGFVLALEGVMLVSHGGTSAVALGVLILINAVSNGSVIALARDATRRKRDSDARGAATRATNRAGSASNRTGAPAQTPRPPTTAPVNVPSASSAQANHTPSHALVVHPWRASFSTVIDAEIVSETRFLA